MLLVCLAQRSFFAAAVDVIFLVRVLFHVAPYTIVDEKITIIVSLLGHCT